MAASVPVNEIPRLEILRQYQILETPPEAAFDDLARLAAYICQIPTALISFSDLHRHWFKAKIGLNVAELDRDIAFCTHAVLQTELFIVEDALDDERFFTNPLVVVDPKIRFYAGQPLVNPDGYVLGTLCVIDYVPRVLTVDQQAALKILAQQVMAQLELRRNLQGLMDAANQQKQMTQELYKSRAALEHAVEGIAQLDAQGRYLLVNRAYADIVGYSPEEMVGMEWQRTVHPEDLPIVVTAYQQMLQTGKGDAEVKGIRKNGSTFFKHVVMVKVQEPKPGLLMHYCFMKDITRRKQAEAGLQLAYAELEYQVEERTAQLSATNQLLRQEVIRRKKKEIAWQQQAKRNSLVTEIAQRIRQSLNLADTLNTTVTEVRSLLQTDRVLLYCLQADGSGEVMVESVAAGWRPLLGTAMSPEDLALAAIADYQQGKVLAIADLTSADLSPSALQALGSFQVLASLVVPIQVETQLWGLLVAHHCSEVRQWQSFEIELLRQLSTQVAIAIQQAHLYEKLEAANQKLHQLASSDGLTQVANRRCFDQRLAHEWERLTREQAPLSLILCDIDYFKEFNDTYGHQAGDRCLQEVAQALQKAIKRPADFVARYGGEEFVIILPNTPIKGAGLVAERIRKQVKALSVLPFMTQRFSCVTLSLGVAGWVPQLAQSSYGLVTAADQSLYQAKLAGRDRVMMANCDLNYGRMGKSFTES